MSWTSWRSGKSSWTRTRWAMIPPKVPPKYHDDPFLTFRVAVVGNVDAGKSTLLGVLTHGELDNGRGFARQKLFRHKHEMESGRTSSVGNDILGFDQEGQVMVVIHRITFQMISKPLQPHFLPYIDSIKIIFFNHTLTLTGRMAPLLLTLHAWLA